MPTIKHIHKYIRWHKGPIETKYRCLDPICTHAMDKKALVGKMSRCTKCDKEFELAIRDLERAKPLCWRCANTNKAKLKRAAAELIDSLGIENDPNLLSSE